MTYNLHIIMRDYKLFRRQQLYEDSEALYDNILDSMDRIFQLMRVHIQEQPCCTVMRDNDYNEWLSAYYILRTKLEDERRTKYRCCYNIFLLTPC